jgi:predicted nucleotidyltransferase
MSCTRRFADVRNRAITRRFDDRQGTSQVNIAQVRACYSRGMEALRRALTDDPRVAYALLFGSTARGSAHRDSDLDVAVGLRSHVRMAPQELGNFVSHLERAAGRSVDVLLLDKATPPVAYRVFRDGRVVVDNDHRALVERKTRAVLEYLDFRPLEQLATAGVLTAAVHGR